MFWQFGPEVVTEWTAVFDSPVKVGALAAFAHHRIVYKKKEMLNLLRFVIISSNSRP